MKEFWVKCEKIAFFSLIFLLPTQLGRHFWFDWSSVWGIRIDYFSPTVYLVDVTFLFLAIFNFSTKGGLRFASQFFKNKIFNFENLMVLVFILVNILIAQNKWVAGYKWLRLGELFWFWNWILKNKKLVMDGFLKAIPWWLIIEGILAVGQVAKGGSLNGWWWWLGERRFDFNTIGIAQMSVADMGLVRAYGTFSHPNSLAGFLLVSLVWWVKNKSSPNPFFDKTGLILKKVVWWLVFWMGLVGIFLSGSRTIWLLTLGFLIFWGWNSKIVLKDKIKGLIVGGLLIFLLIRMINYNYPLVNFFGGWDENGLIKRGQLNLAALQMIRESPWFGVGLGNFLVKLPEFQKNNQIFWFQPVHNILLLLVSEIGLLGLGMVVWLIGRKLDWKKWDKWTWSILTIIFVSGMVDHYWFTLPQNMWLLVLVLGII